MKSKERCGGIDGGDEDVIPQSFLTDWDDDGDAGDGDGERWPSYQMPIR